MLKRVYTVIVLSCKSVIVPATLTMSSGEKDVVAGFLLESSFGDGITTKEQFVVVFLHK